MRELPCECDFPNGTFFKKKEGTNIEVNGHNFHLARVFKENYIRGYECYIVFFEGQPVTKEGIKGKTVILKLRYEMSPQTHQEEDWASIAHDSRQQFLHDCRALESLGGSGYIPKYITHAEGIQSEDGPYPGGYSLVVVMTKLEGIPIVSHGYHEVELSRDEMRYIKDQIIVSHEYFRQNHWSAGYGVEDIFYNREKRHMFYLGLSSLAGDIDSNSSDFQEPFTTSSPYLRVFWDSLPPEWELG